MRIMSKRGSALLISLGVLSFLVISAVAFTIYMRTERQGTSNYRHAVMARQMLTVAFADARDTTEYLLRRNNSTLWPVFYSLADSGADPLSRVLVSTPTKNDLLTHASFKNVAAYSGLLSPAVMEHVPPALTKDVLEARFAVGWRRVDRPKIVRDASSDFDAASSTIAGRYSWMVVNVSDMLDINAIGTKNVVRGVGTNGTDILLFEDSPTAVNIMYSQNDAINFVETRRGSSGPTFETQFVTGADLIAATNSGYFADNILDWVLCNTPGNNATSPAPLTVYSRWPFIPQLAYSKNVLSEAKSYAELTNMVLSCDEDLTLANLNAKKGDSEFNERLKDALKHALMGYTGVAGDHAKYFRLALMDYMDEDDIPWNGDGTQDDLAMCLPSTECTPMISAVHYQGDIYRDDLFDQDQEFPVNENGNALINFHPALASAGTATLTIQLANLFAQDTKNAATVVHEGAWGIALAAQPSAPYVVKGSLGATGGGSVGTMPKGTFKHVEIKVAFPDQGPFEVGKDAKLYFDWFFRFKVEGAGLYDEVPISFDGIDAKMAAVAPNGLVSSENFGMCGERYFHVRYVFQLESKEVEDPVTKELRIVSKIKPVVTGDSNVWPLSGAWDTVDPRYNWFSPASSEARNESGIKAVLDNYGAGGDGYKVEESSIHWYFRPNKSPSKGVPNPLMAKALQVNGDNHAKEPHSETVLTSGTDQYCAFYVSNKGRIFVPGELAFLPRPPYNMTQPAMAADFNAALGNNFGFFQALRPYKYENGMKYDADFFKFFAASKKKQRGLVHSNTDQESVLKIALQGMPMSIEDATAEGAATPPTVSDEFKAAVQEVIRMFIDTRERHHGPEEAEYSDRFLDSDFSAGVYFRNLANVRKLPEFRRKMIAAMSQDMFSRSQQLFLYILRADAYTSVLGRDDLTEGNPSASARAVALVWRNPLQPDAASVSGPWNQGGGSAIELFKNGSDEKLNEQRLVYFQFLE